MPTFKSIETKGLETSITLEEIRNVLKSTKSRKAPGPDGFTVNFYKAFIDIIGPKW